MKIIIIGLLFILACVIILYIILKPYFADMKIRNNVNNFDTFMHNYVFIINAQKQNIIERLSLHNVYDNLEYVFDSENLIICFKHLTAESRYQLEFIPTTNTQTYLLVSKIYILPSGGTIPYMINTFFINKINAKPIDYITFKRTNNISKGL